MLFEGWSELRHLLVLGADGPDVVLPAVAWLRAALPQATVTVVGCTPAWESPQGVNGALPLGLQLGTTTDLPGAVGKLQSHAFEAAILFTAPGQSPYTLAYLCYLAGIPVRIGQSREFGGGVLSHCFSPPEGRLARPGTSPCAPSPGGMAGDGAAWVNPHLNLLLLAGLSPPAREKAVPQPLTFSS